MGENRPPQAQNVYQSAAYVGLGILGAAAIVVLGLARMKLENGVRPSAEHTRTLGEARNIARVLDIDARADRKGAVFDANGNEQTRYFFVQRPGADLDYVVEASCINQGGRKIVVLNELVETDAGYEQMLEKLQKNEVPRSGKFPFCGIDFDGSY